MTAICAAAAESATQITTYRMWVQSWGIAYYGLGCGV